MSIILNIIIFIAGGLFGFLLAALMIANDRRDDE